MHQIQKRFYPGNERLRFECVDSKAAVLSNVRNEITKVGFVAQGWFVALFATKLDQVVPSASVAVMLQWLCRLHSLDGGAPSGGADLDSSILRLSLSDTRRRRVMMAIESLVPSDESHVTTTPHRHVPELATRSLLAGATAAIPTSSLNDSNNRIQNRHMN